MQGEAPGASLYVPFKVKAGDTYSIRLHMAWYVPDSDIRIGADAVTENDKSSECPTVTKTETPQNYRPWYSTRFSSIDEIATYWSSQYDNLKNKTELFTNTFYDTTLPAEIIVCRKLQSLHPEITDCHAPTRWPPMEL